MSEEFDRDPGEFYLPAPFENKSELGQFPDFPCLAFGVNWLQLSFSTRQVDLAKERGVKLRQLGELLSVSAKPLGFFNSSCNEEKLHFFTQDNLLFLAVEKSDKRLCPRFPNWEIEFEFLLGGRVVLSLISE